MVDSVLVRHKRANRVLSSFLIWLVSALLCGCIGMALGSTVDRGGMGFILGLLLGPVGWIVVLLLPRETIVSNSATTTSHMEPKDLSDDAYKIWLGKTYDISKNELFEKYECDGRLFETLDEALQHADESHRAAIKSNAPQVSDVDAQSTQKQDRNDSGFAGIVGAGFIIVMALVIGVAME